MIVPKYLKKGDKIGIVSTARKISTEEIQPAINLIKSWDFEPVIGDNIGKEHHQFAGTDHERAEAFQALLNNPEIKAILCARGGYGTVRMIDKLNFDQFKNEPKWIIGYSDVTVLHQHIHKNYQVETLHATMPINFPKNGSNEACDSLYETLSGENLTYTTEHHSFNKLGNAQGQIIGGNLSIIYSLLGSPSNINTDGKILFLEDLDEYLYHIDRIMMNIKRNGLLTNLAGLVIGGMTDMNDNTIPYGKNALEIILEHVKEFSYPILFNFPAGHIERNLCLKMGHEVDMEVNEEGGRISFI